MKYTILFILALLSLSKSIKNNEDKTCINSDCSIGIENKKDVVDVIEDKRVGIEDEDTDEDEDIDDDEDIEESSAISHDKIIEITDSCMDEHEKCEAWAGTKECEKNPGFMLKSCKLSCGSCMSLNLGEVQAFEGYDSLTVYRQSIEYLEKEVLVKPEYANIRRHCVNTHVNCTIWASEDECVKNPKFMRKGCSLACRSCLDLDIKTRCPIDSSTDAIHSGDLFKMFERITNTSEGSEYTKYQPNILSRPTNSNSKEPANAPWIVEFESFLSNEECDKLIEHGELQTFERSGNVGKINPDGSAESNIDDSRTSENTWCKGECDDDPLVKQVLDRIANFTGIPVANQENLQLLKYGPEKYYKMHHDFIDFHVDRQTGPRVLTFLLYLNELEGGGTQFSDCIEDCDILTKVSPKKGKALLWHNVLLNDPNKAEKRTHHEALPVIDGIKYAANAWIHLRDFRGPMKTGCI